jgi:NAD(P)-dependent dehydrogenase (short-subunit alcohol dehydrogenase family)
MSKTFCVTGATDGIGLETAAGLASRGHRVLMHGRTHAKAQAAVAALSARGLTHLVPVSGDLSVLAEVRQLAESVASHAPVLDGLINNAGVFAANRTLTRDGHELTFQVNHLAHFVLTTSLEGPLTQAPQARVVTVSSVAHTRGHIDLADISLAKGYLGYDAYAGSKLMNVLFSAELARRWAHTKVTTYSLHPGVITTKLLAAGFNATGASTESGAQTSLFCALQPSLSAITGRYYSDSAEKTASPKATDRALAEGLWSLSARLAG